LPPEGHRTVITRRSSVEHSEAVIREANQLYWQTDSSVADIAEKLSVSRRALYELVTPEPAGSSCSVCGGDVVFVNRSAKTSGTGRCQACGAENPTTEAAETTSEDTVPPYAAGWPRARDRSVAEVADDLRTRALKIGGIAVAGAALGAMAALLIARRR
jgi:hypothetical protein